MPDDVRMIIRTLMDAGYEAWAVGGCVRDSLLGRIPKDWDITTSALPQQIKSLFPRTIDTGIEHGTVTVMCKGTGYETTTYRIDGKYSDARHPDSVTFAPSLEEDLKRRDFTINAMAYSDEKGLVDLFGGKHDIDSKIIRCVGDPEARFSEDALRILRAIRFSAQLDFEIDGSTLAAASLLKSRLELISAERIHTELENLIMSGHPDRLKLLHSTGIDEIILPELAAAGQSSEGTLDELVSMLESAPHDRRIRWSVLVNRSGNALGILRRLKFDNNTIHTASGLIRFSTARLNGLTDAEMRKLMHDAGSENMPLIFDFRHVIEPGSDYSASEDQYRAIVGRGECTDLKALAVDGKDLISCGIPAGKEVGETLNRLLNDVLDDPSLNKKELLLERIGKDQK
ncbi:MAG: CCA tRNA nucleotidyltransferase [Lachnospiraceae bacterium]|nr:CCA tRNA nucleotidyltransferase [Lachnospiraceae bacterium]